MKKVISMLLIVILALTAAGCSKQSAAQKTEEERKAAIRAELEAEAHAMVMGPQPTYKDRASFAVFGTIDSITIKYVDSANNKIETAIRKNVTNTLLTIGTNFTNDMTNIKVSFTTKLPDDKTYSNSFTLDDMRDESEYSPILVKPGF